MYEYAATVLAVHDGDTVTINLDLGFHTWLKTDVRLFGIDAPELVPRTGKRTLIKAGEASTQTLMRLLGRECFAENRTASTFGIPGVYLARPGLEPSVVVQTRINKDRSGPRQVRAGAG